MPVQVVHSLHLEGMWSLDCMDKTSLRRFCFQQNQIRNDQSVSPCVQPVEFLWSDPLAFVRQLETAQEEVGQSTWSFSTFGTTDL